MLVWRWIGKSCRAASCMHLKKIKVVFLRNPCTQPRHTARAHSSSRAATIVKKLGDETFLQTALQIKDGQKKYDTDKFGSRRSSHTCFRRISPCMTKMHHTEEGRGGHSAIAISRALLRICASERKRAVPTLHTCSL